MGSGSAGDGLSNDQVMQLLLANDASPNTLGRMYLSLHRRGGAAAAGDTEGGTPLPAEPAPPAAAPPPRRTVAPGVGVMPQQQGPVRATRPVTSSRGDASARPGLCSSSRGAMRVQGQEPEQRQGQEQGQRP